MKTEFNISELSSLREIGRSNQGFHRIYGNAFGVKGTTNPTF